MTQPRKEAARRLYAMAETLSGFFTTKQAKAAGYAENTHAYHVQVGNWVREHRGIYRLAHFPQNDRPDLMLWWLWSRNRQEGLEELSRSRNATPIKPQRSWRKEFWICGGNIRAGDH